jgi:cell division protein FtsW
MASITSPLRPAKPAAPTRIATRQKAGNVQRERHQPEYAILLAIVALTAVGILMVYSSSAMKAYLERDDTFAIVGPQIVWGALGIVALLITMRIDYRLLRLAAVPLLGVAGVFLVIVLLPPIGPISPRIVGGSARWLQIGPLPSVHPAEFAKLALVVYLASWLAQRGTRIKSFWRGTVPFLLLMGPIVCLVLLEPDLGTSSVLGFTAFTMFFLAGARLVHLAGLALAAVPAVAFLFIEGYQVERIRAWLDPWADPSGIGFHSIQGYLALALGGVTGAGLGESRLAGGLFLPNASNDFIFAIIGEEFGLVGGAVVVVLFLAFAYLGIRTALRAPDTFGALLAGGITVMFLFQLFVNVGMNVGIMPITGVTAPLLSFGGSSMLATFLALGLLHSVHAQARETADMKGRATVFQ